METEFQRVVKKILEELETELRFYGQFGKKLEAPSSSPRSSGKPRLGYCWVPIVMGPPRFERRSAALEAAVLPIKLRPLTNIYILVLLFDF